MSHRFTRPRKLSPQERRDDRRIALMANAIFTPEMLDRLLEGAAPEARRLMIDRLRPYLRFTPRPMTDECPFCGAAGGAGKAHECAPVVVPAEPEPLPHAAQPE
jgi:hypothetical protein